MLIRLLLQITAWLVFQSALFFAAAGTLDWPQGWAFVIEFGALCYGISLWLLKADPGLLAERMGGINQAAQPLEDRLAMGGLLLTWCLWCVAMGLDARYHASRLPLWLEVVGGAALAAGFAAIRIVFRANSFAAPVVKIQAERGQRVIDTGPYAWVRHPMYTGGLLVFAGIPLLLGSLWGLALLPLLLAGLVVRTRIEERVLRAKLAGYSAYAARVRWRFVPYVW
ncbi:MAG TPA: isoprenylcysteine carboxylmethyltransferase family protein [Rhizomicrobium sp.]|nr:isoprenylcysteine carboxylmethyltransferase family protein [Rhizomicrobium sp.]